MTLPISVLVVDDDSAVRVGVAGYLRVDPAFSLVGDVADGAAAIRAAADLQPDVVLLDIRLPILDGVAAAPRILQVAPRTRILALTGLASPTTVGPILRAGASGYLLKDATPAHIRSAIKHVSAGRAAFSEGVHDALLDAVRESRAPQRDPAAAGITPRELQIIQSIAGGRTNRAAARQLRLAETTVKTHLRRIMSKWQLEDRTQVVVRAAQLGLIDLTECGPPTREPMSAN